MLTKNDFCDYETCVALEKLEFNDSTDLRYNNSHSLGDFLSGIKAPTLYEAQKWLREEKDIHIEVYACAGGYIYELCKAYKPNSFSGGTTIYTPNDVDNPKLNDAGRYDGFEMCLSEGIKEAVKILKEK